MSPKLHLYTNVILTVIAVTLIALVILFMTSTACAIS